MTRQRKRLIMTTASLVCSLSNSDWRTMVSKARKAAVRAMPISSGTSQLARVLDQNVVDEDLGKARGNDIGHDQREADNNQQGHRGL